MDADETIIARGPIASSRAAVRDAPTATHEQVPRLGLICAEPVGYSLCRSRRQSFVKAVARDWTCRIRSVAYRRPFALEKRLSPSPAS